MDNEIKISPISQDAFKWISDSYQYTRIIVLPFLILAAIFKFGFSIPISGVIIFTLIFWFLITFAFDRLLKVQKRNKVIEMTRFIFFLIELSLVTVIVHFIGGVEWLGVIFYLFTVIYANFLFSATGGFLITVMASIFYVGLVVLEYLLIIPHYVFFIPTVGLYQNTDYLIFTVTVDLAVFYLVTYTIRNFSDLFIHRSDELTAAKEEAARLKEFNEGIVKNAPIGVYTTDKEGCIDSVNPKMCDLAGTENCDRLIGLNILTMPNHKKAGLIKYFKKGLAGEPFEIESVVCDSYPGGKPAVRSYKGVPIKKDGKVERLLLIVEDVSARKELQDKLKTYTQELEQRVRQRTQDLDNKVKELLESRAAVLNVLEDLRVTYEKLKELDLLKSEFIKVVSHQLRTPLSSIRWHAELLLNEEIGKIASEEQKLAVDYIHESVRELITVLENMLISLDIEERNIYIRPEPVIPKNLINEVIREYTEKAKRKNISLELKENEDCSEEANFDPRKIRYVLNILVSNAIKYNKENGRVILEVKRVPFNKGKEGVRFSVADSGIGISQQEIPLIFTKFFRSPGAIRFSPGGIGLGMFISKSFVEVHQGKIWVESEEGRGTTFYFVLPQNGEAGK